MNLSARIRKKIHETQPLIMILKPQCVFTGIELEINAASSIFCLAQSQSVPPKSHCLVELDWCFSLVIWIEECHFSLYVYIANYSPLQVHDASITRVTPPLICFDYINQKLSIFVDSVTICVCVCMHAHTCACVSRVMVWRIHDEM